MDFHCHLDLYPNAREVYKEACLRNTFTWLVTTSPKAFEATSRVLNASPNVLITPGLHPEIAQQKAGELDLLLEQMAGVNAVGEIGIDGCLKHRTSFELQCSIFRAVVERSKSLGGRTLSIHSRQAVYEVLNELHRCPGYGTAVLHWFTGTVTELRTADRMGCWFSVGPAMFASSNGRAVAARLPRDRVVPESDGPFAKIEGKSVLPWSAETTSRCLADVWLTSPDEAAKLLADNSLRLLRLMQVC
jgi:TatD DNase family protein